MKITKSRFAVSKLILAGVILLGGASQSYAQSIWTNPITGANPNTSNPYITGQTVVANLTVSGIGRGSGITGNNAANRYNAASWTTAGSLDTNDYFFFTLTPSAGHYIDFTSLVYTSQRSGTGPNSFAFRSSLDNYASNIGTPTSTGATISLGAASFNVITSPIQFRLYGFAAGGAGGTFSVNNFTFNGSVVSAPEPTSVALFGLGLTGAFALARRRKNS